MTERLLAGFVIALLVSFAGYRAHSLSRSGAGAATLVGTGSMAAGWNWGILLVAYFVVSSALSHFRRAEKEALTERIVEKGGARDAWQVLANGGVFAVLALASALSADRGGFLALGALAALAASAADTWATELGTLLGGTPRSILTFRTAVPGTSGAVSIAGCVAMIAGAAFVAYLAALLGIRTIPPLVLVAGVGGAVTDSVLGATLQARRWCASCEQETERAVHICGTPTSLSGGIGWLTNDAVNLLSTIAGAAVGVAGLTI